MSGFVERLAAQAASMSPVEALAVALAIGYLVLAVRQNIWCWACAFVSTGLYIWLFHGAALFMESALNVFYLVMAVYGWYEWRYGGARHAGLPVTVWPPARHGAALGVIAALTVASGAWLAANTAAAFPYLDSLTTWSAVWATFLVARKVLENWVYWFVIDGLSVYLYLSRGLPLTALLFCFYLVLIPVGFLSWRKDYARTRDALAAA
ncbi:nicotinamide riboside transporter PnuC [Lentisalinibacter salinarum]|uniref:nicotinamide riboside transporter PnuC n=1 Tax=Lentisalinibacter salinarum TaxID=2992239 RepID=UPI0038709329